MFKSVLNLHCQNIPDNLPLQHESRHSEKKESDFFIDCHLYFVDMCFRSRADVLDTNALKPALFQ